MADTAHRPGLIHLLLWPTGRITRSEYWLRGHLVLSSVSALLTALTLLAVIFWQANPLLFVLPGLLLMWPALALMIKRLHDRERTAWWLLTLLIPVVNVVTLVWLLIEVLFLGGTPGDNRFGPPVAPVQRGWGWRVPLLVLLMLTGVANLAVPFMTPAHWVVTGPAPDIVVYIDGEAVRYEQAQRSARAFYVLQYLSLPGPTSPLHWRLLRTVAQADIDAVDDQEVRQLFDALDRDLLRQIPGTTPEFVHETLRDWLGVLDHKGKLLGLSPAPLETRLQACGMLRLAQVRGGLISADGGPPHPVELLAMGLPEVSADKLHQLLAGLNGRVSFTVLPIAGDIYVDQVAGPTDAQVRALYEAHAEHLPAPDRPYGLGYRVPDQVKLEYISLDLQATQQDITIDEEQAQEYYRAHIDEFRVATPDDAPAPENADNASQPGSREALPYADVRQAILARLRAERRAQFLEEGVSCLTSVIQQTEPAAPTDATDDRQPPDWAPMPLDEALAVLEREAPMVAATAHTPGAWLGREDLPNLPGIGQSVLADTGRGGWAPLADYVFSTRELASAGAGNPLERYGLSAGFISAPLRALDGSMYLFRITDVRPSHRPPLEQVRQQVRHDARRVAAYRKLVEEHDRWQRKVVASGLVKVADELRADHGHEARPAFVWDVPRHSVLNSIVPTHIDGIGAHAALMSTVWELAQSCHKAYPGVPSAPPEKRRAVVAIPQTLTLYAVQVENYTPAEPATPQPGWETHVLAAVSLTTDEGDKLGRQLAELSEGALSTRLNVKEATGEQYTPR